MYYSIDGDSLHCHFMVSLALTVKSLIEEPLQ